MKVRTTISVSKGVLEAVDELVAQSPSQFTSRSGFMEAAARMLVARVRRTERTERDVQILNGRADILNAETTDALKYQVNL